MVGYFATLGRVRWWTGEDGLNLPESGGGVGDVCQSSLQALTDLCLEKLH